MPPRLKSLVVENFRSIRGKIVVPLDAQVVLIHGSNGMGKSSVLSAIELALTGQIAHLAGEGDTYWSYLTHFGMKDGAIELSTSAPVRPNGNTEGALRFSDNSFYSTPLLQHAEARFFSERCYLPQATLGRLLEIYDDRSTGTASPLTLFVKELLGLDPLDALVDGLYPAFHVSRIRNLAPAYRRLERLKTSASEEKTRIDTAIRQNSSAASNRLTQLNAVLAQLGPDLSIGLEPASEVSQIRARLNSPRDEERQLREFSRLQAQLSTAMERWRSISEIGQVQDAAERERVEARARGALDTWRQKPGQVLASLLDELRKTLADIPTMDESSPELARSLAEKRAELEAQRCDAILAEGDMAANRLAAIEATIQRSSARIGELDEVLGAGIADVRSLANALASVAPHIDAERCPVCERDFSEMNEGTLAAHVAAKIASLTTEAGRLQALAAERAEESERLATVRRELLSVEREQLPQEERAVLILRSASMASMVQRLKPLMPEAQRGTALMTQAATAISEAAAARNWGVVSSRILPEIDQLTRSITGRSASDYDSLDAAFEDALEKLSMMIRGAEEKIALRIRVLAELDYYEGDLAELARLREASEGAGIKLHAANGAISQVDRCREDAKQIATAAERVRSNTVKAVFNNSLNKVWRDLFVRLAPSEQFVPQFKLPAGDQESVEAVLETLHRSGQASGRPGAILSQGNLNTAALTLFLALHLSVPSKIPWLVLDDPVQSMDDVHIAQFAALLRTFSKSLDRQLIVAVHERALFEYLTLELSPAFPEDSLVSVEISRNFVGEAIATPRAFAYKEDQVIAA
ncbi:AAA family ATPase [Bradyrhizobium uaiense]|uniref:AAA family ATPase n=1 Tax=Bradyrhizobium uaiense TaxID=2594946 RepID=A0A6P1BEP8_9BRAD|nr:AAA family ATPase [Bradyrhizobium uaiense]NEU96927.1 AAA family ATPase [Bradyrhizobium uaiense]